MILRRFTRAIADQNWSTVLLELVVVIVGIFLGLQVDDWNESRKLRQEESIYLKKLVDDLIAMQAELTKKVERSDEARKTMIAALSALEDCRISDSTRSDLDFALERYQILAPFNYLNATYDEMVASGALARIADQGLKQKIAYSFAQLADINANQRNFRASMPVVDEIVWRTVSYSVDRNTGRIVVSYEMAELCNDVALRNAIVEMIDIQWDSNIGAARALESVDDLIASLGSTTRDFGWSGSGNRRTSASICASGIGSMSREKNRVRPGTSVRLSETSLTDRSRFPIRFGTEANSPAFRASNLSGLDDGRGDLCGHGEHDHQNLVTADSRVRCSLRWQRRRLGAGSHRLLSLP